MTSVLVVDDEVPIQRALAVNLRARRYDVLVAATGEQALQMAARHHPDVVILDLGLPGKDGLDVLDSIRARNNPVPLLIITARDGLDDRLRGLDGGADDYLLKPFDMAELLARMRAVLRRKGGTALSLLDNGVVALDLVSKQASTADNPDVQLSSREFALLQALLIRPGAILSRSELEDRLYGWGNEVESNAVEFLIHALRRKLGSHVIKNVRGMGWMVSKGA